jgi:hypothetical protein
MIFDINNQFFILAVEKDLTLGPEPVIYSSRSLSGKIPEGLFLLIP